MISLCINISLLFRKCRLGICQCLVSITYTEAPHYANVSITVLRPTSYVHIFSLAPCSHALSVLSVKNQDSHPHVRVYLAQVFGTLGILTIWLGFTGVYGMMVCVACSQLEKLRAALLVIKPVATEQERTFSRMQVQLNACIRHHQEINGEDLELSSL
jgi:hypothetical protein